jgi:hypothetical protein
VQRVACIYYTPVAKSCPRRTDITLTNDTCSRLAFLLLFFINSSKEHHIKKETNQAATPIYRPYVLANRRPEATRPIAYVGWVGVALSVAMTSCQSLVGFIKVTLLT